MEIDITRLFTGGIDTWPLSGSNATHGANAGPSTWAAAKDQAAETPFLVTDAEVQACRDHVQAMGFSEDLQAFDAVEVNALFLQLVSGDMREGDLDEVAVDDDEAWAKYEERAQEGNVSGNIGRGWSDAAGMLYDAAVDAGWLNYCGTWIHPTHTVLKLGPFAPSSYEVCALMGVIPPCDAVYYSLSD